jgi:hypothetical protein
MRAASTLGVSVCFAVFAWRVSEAEREADVGWWLFSRGPVRFALLAVFALCTAVAAFRLIRGTRPRHWTWPPFAVALAVALRAATPIRVAYNDGCNDHWGVSPAVAAPFVALTRPQAAFASYNDIVTLMACSNSQ